MTVSNLIDKYGKSAVKKIFEMHLNGTLNDYLSDIESFVKAIVFDPAKVTVVVPSVRDALKLVELLDKYNIAVIPYVSPVEGISFSDLDLSQLKNCKAAVFLYDRSPEAETTLQYIKEQMPYLNVQLPPIGVSALKPANSDLYTLKLLLDSVSQVAA